MIEKGKCSFLVDGTDLQKSNIEIRGLFASGYAPGPHTIFRFHQEKYAHLHGITVYVERLNLFKL